MRQLTARDRVVLAACAAAVLAATATGYILHARQKAAPATGFTESGTALAAGPAMQALSNGVLSTVSLRDPAGPRVLTSLNCDRAHAAADTVACLTPVDALRGTHLMVLNSKLLPKHDVPLTGFPNRLRVSATGRMVAWTLFIDGHSYNTAGFSTQTGILDTRTGSAVQSLEEFAAFVDGQPHRAADINLWGVTFTDDDNRFYATMSTGGRRYLVAGDFAAKTLRAIAENVECPSLSPDGRRIAFKAAVGGDPANGWRLSVLDLTTMKVTPTAESRSVDDQPLWTDGDTVAYALQRSDGINEIWTARADGTGRPGLLVSGANSPALLSAGDR
ncbi:MAG TPA: hypothetical protein VF062_22745 [Candidatus Limnocylindrales bacterium]